VGCAGDARQLEFNPFEDPQRAAREEFGDVLAEGLYALFGEGDGLGRATEGYWDRFIESRAALITTIDQGLPRLGTESVQAHASLEVAKKQLGFITGADCLRFIEAWQEDRRRFAKDSTKLQAVGSVTEALNYMGLRDWQIAEFGTAEVATRCIPAAPSRAPQESRFVAPGKRNRSSIRSPESANI